MLLNFDRLGALEMAAASASPSSSALFLLLPILFIVGAVLRLVAVADLPAAGLDAEMVSRALRRPALDRGGAAPALKIAVMVTVLSVLLGLLASFGLIRGRFPRPSRRLRALFLTPMILPVVVLRGRALRLLPADWASTAPSSASSSPI